LLFNAARQSLAEETVPEYRRRQGPSKQGSFFFGIPIGDDQVDEFVYTSGFRQGFQFEAGSAPPSK
jgi:hypothetical protein